MKSLINHDPKIRSRCKDICDFINSSKWKKSTLCVGYNTKGDLSFYLIKGNRNKEIPFSWELILEEGIKKTLEFINSCNPFIVMDAKSYRLISIDYFE